MKAEKAMETANKMSRFFVKKLVPEAKLPLKGTPGAAGYDLCSI